MDIERPNEKDPSDTAKLDTNAENPEPADIVDSGTSDDDDVDQTVDDSAQAAALDGDDNRTENGEADGTKSTADEAALELMKQLITLGSGLLALGAAFIDKLPKTPKPFLVVLVFSWVALIISLLFGLQTISAIVKSRIDNSDEWSTGKGRTYGRISRYSFLAGITMFVTFGFMSLAFPSPKEKEITITIKADDPTLETIKQSLRKDSSTPATSPNATSGKPNQ